MIEYKLKTEKDIPFGEIISSYLILQGPSLVYDCKKATAHVRDHKRILLHYYAFLKARLWFDTIEDYCRSKDQLVLLPVRARSHEFRSGSIRDMGYVEGILNRPAADSIDHFVRVGWFNSDRWKLDDLEKFGFERQGDMVSVKKDTPISTFTIV